MTGIYGNELITMQNALIAYANGLKQYSEKTKEIRATYNETAQNIALADQREILNGIVGDSASRIESAGETLKQRISERWEPKATLYNRDIVAMLNDGLLKYSAKDIEEMAKKRYMDNPTMLQVLRGYAETSGEIKQLKSDSVLLFASKGKKLEAAESLKQEIINIIQNAGEKPGHVESVSWFAENFEKAFENKLKAIGEI
ncbi:hypothetical protein [Massiliimalia timonensis]|uniref:hypothetical protein n=1 Tax=Massiliimalia timonensis TaxID=1987501 RepID=UPI00189D2471|nr:hypothetical protein [Massiliimalia timonensis]